MWARRRACSSTPLRGTASPSAHGLLTGPLVCLIRSRGMMSPFGQSLAELPAITKCDRGTVYPIVLRSLFAFAHHLVWRHGNVWLPSPRGHAAPSRHIAQGTAEAVGSLDNGSQLVRTSRTRAFQAARQVDQVTQHHFGSFQASLAARVGCDSGADSRRALASFRTRRPPELRSRLRTSRPQQRI